MTTAVLGVLGGMGPLATLEFLKDILDLSGVRAESDHVPMRIEWRPDVPNRQDWFSGRGRDPYPALMEAFDRLVEGGAGCSIIAMPCNTTHTWHAQLAQRANVIFPHIAHCVAAALMHSHQGVQSAAVLGTNETISQSIYEAALGSHGLSIAYPARQLQRILVEQIIPLTKQGNLKEARERLAPVLDAIVDGGAESIILACTELPLLCDADDWRGLPVINSGRELARQSLYNFERLNGCKPQP